MAKRLTFFSWASSAGITGHLAHRTPQRNPPVQEEVEGRVCPHQKLAMEPVTVATEDSHPR